MRLSSPELSEAAIRGALDAGCDVDDIGLAGTEMMYYAVGEHGYEGGIAVTASHNPAEYNGMKIVRRGALPVGGDTGLDKMRTIALAATSRRRPLPVSAGTFPVLDGFTEKVLSIVDVDAIAPLKVVLDGGNGMAGTMLSQVLPRLPIQAIPCYMEPDGTFPHHLPNPLLEENRAFIVGKVREEGADLGIAWDGDADRCFFVDDEGEFVPGDFMTALLAEATLRSTRARRSSTTCAPPGRCPTPSSAAADGPSRSRVGHAFIKVRMREEDAQFAGEVSGHYYFRDFYSVDTGIVPRCVLLELVSRKGGSLAKLIRPLREKYHISGEINTPVRDVALKLQELRTGSAPAPRCRTSTACRSTSPTGTSTCGRPTPSRCCA